MCGLLGQNHRPPLPHAQNPARLLEQIGGLRYLIGADEAQRLRSGVDIGGKHLLAHIGDGVVGQHFACQRVAGAVAGGGVGHSQLEGVVALIVQPSAEAGDGGLSYTALLGQLRDRHELGLLLMHDHIVCHFLLRRSQLVILVVDFGEYVSVGHSGTPFPCGRIHSFIGPEFLPTSDRP